MGSSTSTDVAGFRIGAELGRGRRTVVYEAFQLDLERRVALKLLPAGERTRLQWPEHPRVVSLYATGACDRGRYVAMQLVRGPTLAQLLEGGGPAPARALELLADVASALDAAHESGIAHGAVAGRNVLVDENGRALLSDFGLGSAPPTVAADQADFAALVRDALGDRAVPPGEPPAPGELVRHARAMLSEPPPPRRRRRAALAAAVVAGVAAVVAIAAADGRDDGV